MCRFLTGLILSWLLYAHPANAQSTRTDPAPTRWINYAQTYYRIPVAQEGLYRLTTADLSRAGLPVHRLDPRTLQLFYRGVEQAIYVAGEADGRLDADDFLEFYGRGNDGTPDSLLYRPDGLDTSGRSPQPHPYYSLFSDTTTYFLTWRLDGQPGRRMTFYVATDRAGLVPEPYVWAEERRLFTDEYPGWAAGIPPQIEYSHYQAGEGYTGPIRQKDVVYPIAFTLANALRDGPPPVVEWLLAGRDYTGHRVACQAGSTLAAQRTVGTLRFSTYGNARLQTPLTWADVGTGDELLLSTVSRGDDAPTDRYSVSSLFLRFPQRLVPDTRVLRLFRLRANPAGRSLLTLPGWPEGTRFWDVTDPTNPIRLGNTDVSDTTQLVIRQTTTERLLLSSLQPQSVSGIRPISFSDWRDRRPTYLIVSHERLMQPAGDVPNPVRAYAAYRASVEGGSHDTLTVTMQQLFDQFSYGERSPLAIRRFASQMLRQAGGRAPYLLLLGRGRSTPGIRRDPQQATLDMVMTAGFPGSDVLFTAGLDNQSGDVPALPTGRINAGTPQTVLDYLNKVKEYERQPPTAPWRKRILHLSGGSTPAETQTFRQLVVTYQQRAVGTALGAQVSTLTKATDQPVERIDLSRPVNDGLGLVTFFGHSGLDVTDLDIGFCSADALGYRNKGQYPMLLINGCAVGNFFYGRPTLTTDWVLTPDRGAIAALAQSHLGYVDNLDRYSTAFYELITDSTQLDQPIGWLQRETIRRVLARSPTGPDLANCQQMVLQGDPAVRLFPFRAADYVLTAASLRVLTDASQPLTTLSDSVRVQVVIQNNGQYRPGRLPIRVRRLRDGQEVGVFNQTLPQTVAYRDTVVLTLPNSQDSEGLNRFEVTVNPPDRNGGTALPETDYANNRASIEQTITGQRPTLIFPAPGAVVGTRALRLTASYPTERPCRFTLELDTTARFDSPRRVREQVTTASVISWPTSLPDAPGTVYYWRVRLADDAQAASPDNPAGWSVGNFTYAPGSPGPDRPEGQLQRLSSLPADVQQGDVFTFTGQFVNLSPRPFADSVLVRQVVYAASQPDPLLTEWRLPAPAGYDTLRVFGRLATETLPGLNRVMLTVNPHLQAEYSFLNNTIDLPVVVQPDVIPPFLEVAFDGVRLENGATVSAQPRLDILVADDNRALLRRDTTGLDLYLQAPGANQPFHRLSWKSATIVPATGGSGNVFRLQTQLFSLSEGVYHLRITAHDAVGNAAAPYEISFRVVAERALTNVLVYPNPFRERASFAFQLTGSHPPETVRLTITDLSGRPVRHLSTGPTGSPGRIGLNEWRWDGRNDAGEALPAGVYLYQLFIESAQQPWPGSAGGSTPGRGRIILLR